MLVPRSADAYATLLGILKAGAAYVPLDPEYPADRVEYILENCAATALVTIAELAGRHAGLAARSSALTPTAKRSTTKVLRGCRGTWWA